MALSRKMKLKLNTIFGFLYQLTAVICGLIVPRLILSTYGTEVNGLVNSIQSILNIITLMELGVGAVIQTALYKPLANGDMELVSKIVISAKRFFRIVGFVFVIFVVGIVFSYPFFVSDKFDIYSTMFLIVAISISQFAQYFFGLVYGLLIQADQKVFVYNIIQIVSLVINTVACALLIKNGFSIQIVKFTTSLIFLLRPILLYIYVKRYYNLMKLKPDGSELKQKWNGIIQHISAYILENTDLIVLTLFASLSSVSIYSVYYLIAHNIRLLIVSLTNGITSYYGNVYAKGENEILKKDFDKYNYFIWSLSTYVFSVTIIMIVPFVTCYTYGVNDANYNQLVFGILLVLGQFFYCTRRSFNLLIMAAGHYKETQVSAIIEAVINLVLSIALVISFDLIGVAIGTLVAMLFRTIYFAYYCSKNIINRPVWKFFKELLLNSIILAISIIFAIYVNNNYDIYSYFEWVVKSCIFGSIMLGIFILINVIFNWNLIKETLFSLKKKIWK